MHREEIETVNINGTRFIIDGRYLTLPLGVGITYQNIIPLRKKLVGIHYFLPNASQFWQKLRKQGNYLLFCFVFFFSLIPDSAMGYDMRASTVVQLLQLLTIMFNLMAESVRMSDINNFHV